MCSVVGILRPSSILDLGKQLCLQYRLYKDFRNTFHTVKSLRTLCFTSAISMM